MDRETMDRETADRETADREATDQETTDRETTDRKTTVGGGMNGRNGHRTGTEENDGRTAGDGLRDSRADGAARRGRRGAFPEAGGRGVLARGLTASIAVHAILALSILGAAWGVAATAREEDEAPVVLTADFDAPAPRAADAPATNDPTPEPPPRETNARDDAGGDLAARLRALEAGAAPDPGIDALARRFAALAPTAAGPTDGGAPPAARTGASFAGLVSGRANDIAYVVDASGSMVGTFPKIVDEVERSIGRLAPTQRFTVVVYQRDGADSFADRGTLVPASRAERARAVAWLRERVPAGRSNPMEALGVALASGADCIFLLSTTVTGEGRHDLDRDTTLALLDRLNPRDPATGLRRATIQCIQFLAEDPGGTLEAVAAAHFGEGGYRFIARSAVGLDEIESSVPVERTRGDASPGASPDASPPAPSSRTSARVSPSQGP
jgi:hypothetical protein